MLILLFLLTVVVTSAISLVSWSPFTPKYVDLDPKEWSAEHTWIPVPQDYFAEHAAAGATVKLRVRRYGKRGHPVFQNMWIIPGGPGQHSNDFESGIHMYLSLVPAGTVIYLLDHRGTGRSGKVISSKLQKKCMDDLHWCDSQSQIPLKAISLHNAARDFVELTRGLSAPHQKWYVYGASYGGLLAYTIYQMAGGMFAGIMADSMPPELRAHLAVSSDIRHHIASNCAKDRVCSAYVNPADIPHLMGSALSANNACSKTLISSMYTLFDLDPTFASRELNAYLLRMVIRLVAYRGAGRQPQATILALLRSTVQCNDLGLYNRGVNPLLTVMSHFFRGSQRVAASKWDMPADFVEHTSLNMAVEMMGMAKKTGKKDSDVLLNHLLISELGSEDFRECSRAHTDRLDHFLNICDIRTFPIGTLQKWSNFRYTPHVERLSAGQSRLSKMDAPVNSYGFQPVSHKQPSGDHMSQELNNSDPVARFIVLASKMDGQTPFDRAEEAFNAIPVSNKHIFIYDNLPHVVLGRGEVECDQSMMDVLFAASNTEANDKASHAHACIRSVNDRHVDWRAATYAPMQHLWDNQRRSHPLIYGLVFGLSLAPSIIHAVIVALGK